MTKLHEHYVASGSKSSACPRIVSVPVFAAILAAPFCAGAFNWSDYAAGAVVTVTGEATATDAVLEAKGPVVLKTLTADASGAGNGTVKGFTFAAAGVLDVRGLAAVPGRLDIPFTFDDCAGIENISKWTLTIDGAPSPKYHARASATGVSLFSTGTLIYIK